MKYLKLLLIQLVALPACVYANASSIVLHEMNAEKKKALKYRIVYDYKTGKDKKSLLIEVFVELITSKGKVKDRLRVPFGYGDDGQVFTLYDTKENLPGYNGKKIIQSKRGINFGVENFSFSLSFQNFRLTKTKQAILVNIRLGFEHVAYHDLLVAVVNGKLRMIWSRQPMSQPRLVSAFVTKSRKVLVYRAMTPHYYTEKAEYALKEVIAYHWNNKSKKMTAYKAPVTNYQLTVEPFSSAKAAVKYQDKFSSCVGGYWVLPAEKSQGAVAVLSRDYLEKIPAEHELARVKKCLKNKQVKLIKGHINTAIKIPR